MAKISNKELLKIAQSESTTPEQLSKIWTTSRSIKVRKAVASNPNASALTLRAAARLYLEEVLDNPAFQLLRLFDDNEWVQKIGEIYENPEKWEGWAFGYSYGAGGRQFEAFGKAALLSPRLSSHAMSAIMELLPVSSLTRAFKYHKTRENSRKIVFGCTNDFTIEALFKVYNCGLCNEKELFQCLKGMCFVGSLSCRKSTYTRAMKSLLKEYEDKPEEAGPTISIVLLSSRASCIGWVKPLFNESHLPIVASAILAAKKILNKNISAASSSAKAGANIRVISSIVTELLWGTLDFEEKKKNLGSFYKRICQLGLENHGWGDFKFTCHPLMLSGEIENELMKKDIRVKTFFVKNYCLGRLFCVQRSDSMYRLLEEVNSWLYEQGGIENTLYRFVPLNKKLHICLGRYEDD